MANRCQISARLTHVLLGEVVRHLPVFIAIEDTVGDVEVVLLPSGGCVGEC